MRKVLACFLHSRTMNSKARGRAFGESRMEVEDETAGTTFRHCLLLRLAGSEAILIWNWNFFEMM